MNDVRRRWLPAHLQAPAATAGVLALHSLSLFLVIALLARHAPAAELGYYVLGYAIGAPVFMFLNARQRLVLVNHIGLDDPTWTLARKRLMAAAAGTVGISACAFALWGAEQPDKALVVSLVAATKAAESISDIVYGGLQRAAGRHNALLSISGRALVSAAACAVVAPLTGSAVAASATLLAVWSAFAWWDWQGLVAANPPTAHRNPVRAASLLDDLGATVINPLALSALLVSLAYYVPRYFLNASAGDAALGVFGALSYLGLVVQMLGYAVADSLMPGLAQRHQQHLVAPAYLADMRRLYVLLLAAGILGAATLLLAGDLLLILLLGKDFAGMAPLAAALLAAGTVMAINSCQMHALVALGLHKAQLVAALCAFGILLLASAMLIPRAGMAGAAAADLLYATASVLLVEICLQRHVRKANLPP